MKKHYVGTITKVTPTMGFDLNSDSQTVEGYMVEYADSYRTWLPKETFEATYRPVEGINFGMAVELLKTKVKVARKGWNGKGMWLELQVPDEHSKMTRPYIYMCLPYGSTNHFGDDAQELDRVPWLPSQTDILATDYFVVEDVAIESPVAPETFETGIEDPDMEAPEDPEEEV